MPGVQAGVYPGELDAGTEVSSTYEGRHLTVYEAELIHPYHADGFVDKGEPVILCDSGVPTTYGLAVGVAFNSASAATDLIALDTEGIWNLTVYAEDDDGNSAVEIGDPLFIRAGGLPGAADADGTGDAEISKIRTTLTQVPFGYALGSIVAGGSGVIAVKVHWDNVNDPIEIEQLAEGWSLNLIKVVSTATVGEGTRGLRINMQPSDSIASGDMQCFHGYMTLGADPELAAGAAISPLSAWLDVPDDTTVGAGAVLCAVRAIFDPNNNDLSVIAGGGESALFYGQTWASTGTLDHGLAIIAGAGSTIDNCIHAVGTFTRLLDFSECAGPDANVNIATWPTREATGRIIQWYMGDLATRATIRAFTGDLISEGSMYFSSAGEAFMKVASTTADTDWEVINHEAADAG